MKNVLLPKLISFCICFSILFSLSGCSLFGTNDEGEKNDSKIKITEEYLTYLAGKTFESDGSMMTFYEEGIATYDYFEHHYGYEVEVVEATNEYIKMLLTTVVIQSDDYIDNGPEEAIFYISDNTLKYYKTYTCIFDPNDPEYFSNSYGTFNTVCANEECNLFIALSGNTKYCPQHSGTCKHCGDYLDPGVESCDGCPVSRPSQNGTSGDKKCYLCNGTGKVKYYYGNSDLEAYLNGHEPYWYGQCGSCQGTGIEK